MKTIYKGHEIEVTRDRSMAGYSMLFYNVFRQSDGYETIDTGDHVRHAPSGEEWVVAYVQGDRLAWCGWPEGEALLADCTLLSKATPEYRQKLLQDMAAMPGDDARKWYAVRRLAQ